MAPRVRTPHGDTRAPDPIDDLRREYEAKLNEISDAFAAEQRKHAEEIGTLQQTLGGRADEIITLRTRLDQREKALKDERAAHDETKGELLDALLQIERLRGYLNALQDAQPPRMVAEDRELRGAERRETYAVPRRYSDPPAKPFFARGS